MEKILIETSARHVHVTKEALAALFGEDYKLEIKKMLSQPGQFASNTKLNIIGPKSTIKNVSILGPERGACQVEVSATDARTLGVKAPIRESGDTKGSAPIILENPETGVRLELEEGCIIAKRHIHMTPEDAKNFNVTNGQIVSVKVTGTGREIVFGDTVIRISEKYKLAMHIDTDESNAGNCFGEVYGEIIY